MSRPQWTAEGREATAAERPVWTWTGRALLAVLAGVLLLLVAGVAFRWLLHGHGEPPEAVVRRYLDAGGTGDRPAMISCLTSAGRAAVEGSAEVMPGELDAGLADGSLGAASLEAGRALVLVKVTEAPRTHPVCDLTERWYPFVLVEERGTWRIDLEATGRVMMDGLVPGSRPESR